MYSENNMNYSMCKKPLLVLLIVFVGILGVIGIYEDISMLQGQEVWGESKIYGKYFAALLGTVSHAFVQYMAKKRINDSNT